MTTQPKLPRQVHSRDGLLTGEPTGGTRRCNLEGCTGLRIGIRWPDGKLTWPCIKAMEHTSSRTWKIC